MTDRRQQNSVQNEISNKIKISIRRPVFRFVDDAVQSLKQYQEIELSGLGLGKLFIFKYAFCVSTIKISSKLHIKKKLFTFCSKRRRIQNLFWTFIEVCEAIDDFRFFKNANYFTLFVSKHNLIQCILCFVTKAINTLVSVADILRSQGFATIKSIQFLWKKQNYPVFFLVNPCLRELAQILIWSSFITIVWMQRWRQHCYLPPTRDLRCPRLR